MALMDALRSGVDLSNAMNQGVITSAQARYAYPMTRADLEKMRLANQYQQIINQYQPDKSRLENQYQGLVNTYYGPEHQANIDYQNIVNKYAPDKMRLGNEQAAADLQYTPLKYAIEAQNSMRNNSRFGGAYQYLKSIADMPAAQKSIYLADPTHHQEYMDMIGQLHEGMQQGGNSQVITPALLKRVGLDTISSDVVSNAPTQQRQAPQSRGGLAGGMPAVNSSLASPAPQAPVNINIPQAPQMSAPSGPMQMNGGLGAPVFGGMTPMGAPPVMSPPTAGGMAAPMMGAPQQAPAAPMPARTSPNAPLMQNTPPLDAKSAQISNQYGISPESANTVGNDAKNGELTPQKRQLLGFQMRANEQLAGQKVTNQALAAIAYEKLLVQNQERFAPAFENAAKYAGALGQGKLTLDKFRTEHPKEYSDYTWVVNDLIPALGQNVRRIEGLAATDGQREALNEMYHSVLDWKSDPKMALDNINKTMKLFNSQAKSVLEAAQPVFPGALEKLYGVEASQQDYVGEGRAKGKGVQALSNDELMRQLQGGK